MGHLFLLEFNFRNHCWRDLVKYTIQMTPFNLPYDVLKCMLSDFPVSISMDLSLICPNIYIELFVDLSINKNIVPTTAYHTKAKSK